MSKDSNIKSYTAIDIEKYHKGLLSPREMHDLEKAALDDPFLADALEGYSVPGINVAADIAELKKRLTDRTEENQKVIPLASPPRSSFPWLRAAAMLILIFGAAFLVYQFGFNKESSPIAKTDKKVGPTAIDSNLFKNAPVVNLNQVVDSSTSNLITTTKDLASQPAKLKAEIQANREDIITSSDSVAVASGYSNYLNNNKSEKAAVAPPPPAKTELDPETQEKKLADERILRRQNSPTETPSTNRDNATAVTKQSNVSEEAFNDKNINRTNIFRGQVTDADKNVVPFANITNRADNIGTYADAKGNFTLTSPDTVLNVQVRSLGYENNNSQLNNRQLNNQVVLQEDRSLKEVVVSQKKVNSTRSRTSTMVLEEPEPVDGWTNYDTYLANNLNVPDNWRSKQSDGGEVTLSFEVNSKGQPVNITVDKSLCESCDKEAIRLIKEGPKWKRKSRKGRTTVTVTF